MKRLNAMSSFLRDVKLTVPIKYLMFLREKKMFMSSRNLAAESLLYKSLSNTRLILAKNQAKAKQHHETELSLFENYSLSSSTLSSKNKRGYNKLCTKENASVNP